VTRFTENPLFSTHFYDLTGLCAGLSLAESNSPAIERSQGKLQRCCRVIILSYCRTVSPSPSPLPLLPPALFLSISFLFFFFFFFIQTPFAPSQFVRVASRALRRAASRRGKKFQQDGFTAALGSIRTLRFQLTLHSIKRSENLTRSCLARTLLASAERARRVSFALDSSTLVLELSTVSRIRGDIRLIEEGEEWKVRCCSLIIAGAKAILRTVNCWFARHRRS